MPESKKTKEFQEQIGKRQLLEDEQLSEAFLNLSTAVMGKPNYSAYEKDEQLKKRSALEEVLHYFGIPALAKLESTGDPLKDLDRQLDAVNLMKRTVKLTDSWYKDATGPLLGQTVRGDVVALIPRGSGYYYFDYEKGKRVKVDKRNASSLEESAFCFYARFPQKEVGIKDLLLQAQKSLDSMDYFLVIAIPLIATLAGLIYPVVNQYVFSEVVPTGETSLLGSVTFLLFGVALSTMIIKLSKSLVLDRINQKISLSISAAAYERVLSLPTSFFRKYPVGDVSMRLQRISSVVNTIIQMVFSVGVSTLFSLVYIVQIFSFSPALVLPTIVVLLVTLVLTTSQVLIQSRVASEVFSRQGTLKGFTYAIITGIQKIKLAGAEKRTFVQWMKRYQEMAELSYDPPLFLKLAPALTLMVSVLGMLLIYDTAILASVSVADYMAFSAAYGMVSGALSTLSRNAIQISSIKPSLEMAQPILKTLPETHLEGVSITELSGDIEVSHVSFRYSEEAPSVLEDVSLKVAPGEYVAIVGATGCGKSTLLRLLLGFEVPEKGAVYYDGRDVANISPRSLRRRIGVVLQNGKLLHGSIFSNITIASPGLTLDEAWEAAELADIAEDIKAMPMGMNTLISEGSGGISGGQRQRILIARAVATKPSILMLDEATSALDNASQREVAKALGSLKSTRIVIAHRLSTVRNCDRIIMLKDGAIVEQGSFEELIALGGAFKDLVQRQQIEE